MKRSRPDGSAKTRKKQRLGTATDILNWRPVALPDHLEDAEGFFGLEEIDGVEIVKEDGGRIRFQAIATAAQTEPEWEGFGEVENFDAGQDGTADSRSPPKKKKAKKPTLKKPQESSKNDFSALQDAPEDDTDVSAWLSLGLSEDILSALAKLKFSKPTPIQIASIPEILAGEDVIGKASTGSGKTLAFGIPIIESILNQPESSKAPAALILSPTRELAHQISQHIINVCTNLTVEGPRVATITGGLSIQKQERQLEKADIIIGTPGRLWEVVSSTPGCLNRMKKIRFLVADEADRLLSEGHFKEVEEILEAIDKKVMEEDGNNEDDASPAQKRQTLVFSATFQKDLQKKLVNRKQSSQNILDNQQSLDYLKQKLKFRAAPKFIDVNPVQQMVSKLQEGILRCDATEKDLYLYATLLLYPKSRTLVFTNAISSVRRLVELLQELKLNAVALHSEMAQKARLRSVERFSDSSNKNEILVATDVAARGLDIPSVDLVLHYHVPRAADAYVHRSGRTARADAAGMSIMLCSPDEALPVQRLVGKIHSKDNKTPVSNLSIDPAFITKIKPRITVASTVISVSIAKARVNSDKSWMQEAAEDLGVDLDGEEFAEAGRKMGGRGRGGGRERQMKEDAGVSKKQLAIWRGELQELLSRTLDLPQIDF